MALPVAERKNETFMTSYVTAGRGKGIVIATGHEYGGRADCLSDPRGAGGGDTVAKKAVGSGETIEYSYDRAVRFIICPRRLAEARRDGNAAHRDFPAVAAGAGGAFRTTVTIVLALGVTKMARAGTIVRRLPSVETLGGSQRGLLR